MAAVKLKFENVAVVGDRIRAHDFRHVHGCYVEGTVKEVDKESRYRDYACYVIEVDKDTMIPAGSPNSRVGQTVYVPMEVALIDWDDRVQNLSS